MNIISGILLALQYAPYVIQAVIAIEQAFKGIPNAGQTKKQIIMGSVQTVVPNAPNDTLDALSKIIDTQVGLLNSAGIFSKSSK